MTGEEMWHNFCLENHVAADTAHDMWKFCGGGPGADALAGLVLQGKKTATAGLKRVFDAAGVPLPQEGCLSVILFDNDEAACVIRATRVSLAPFDCVGAEHAAKEGEGDGSAEGWKTAHRSAFAQMCAMFGLSFSEKDECVLEEFEVAYRATAQ